MTSPFKTRRWLSLLRRTGAVSGFMLFTGVVQAGSGQIDPQKAGSNPVEAKPRIYKHLSGGITTFSDVPPSKGAYIILNDSCYACNLTSTINWHTTKLYLDEFRNEINMAAEMFKLESSLVRAVIHAESGFKPLAKSKKGALGLMQLMPFTAREVGVEDATVPVHNIRGGAQYLARLLVQFKGDVALAVAAYNAGPSAVERYKGIPPYAETQAYVQRVTVLHQRYRSVPSSPNRT